MSAVRPTGAGIPQAPTLQRSSEPQRRPDGNAPRGRDGFERSVSLPVLRRGSTGSTVAALQQRLVSAGFMSPAEFKSGRGVYGPRTEAAVRRLQAVARLPETGVADGPTQVALSSGARFEAVPRQPVRRSRSDDDLEITQPAARPSRETLTEETTAPNALPAYEPGSGARSPSFPARAISKDRR